MYDVRLINPHRDINFMRLCRLFKHSSGEEEKNKKIEDFFKELKEKAKLPVLDYEKGKQFYDLLRDYIKHEDGLINNRMTWLITVQSFLLATFGFSLQKRLEVVAKIIFDEHQNQIALTIIKSEMVQFDRFLAFLAFVGFSISLVGLISIKAALKSIASLRKKWEDLPKSHEKILDYFPNVVAGGDTTGKPHRGGRKLPIYLPVLFMVVWGLVFLGSCYYYNNDRNIGFGQAKNVVRSADLGG